MFEMVDSDKAEKKPRPKRKNATTSEIAVVANAGGTGVLLNYDGPGLEWMVDGSSRQLDDLGLDDAPDGISIWEGKLTGGRVGNGYDGYDYDYELIGEFRDPTPEEWERIKEAEAPWEFEG